MRVIDCSDYLERRQALSLQAARTARAAPVARPRGFWRWLFWWISGRRRADTTAQTQRADELEAQAIRFAQGRNGEEEFIRILAARLDDRYTLLSGYTPPPPWHVGGDIDGVLVGPHGVTVIEVKAWRGFYRYSEADWLFRRGRRYPWEPARKNPTAQAQANTQRLLHILEDHGLQHTRVFSVIAVAVDTMQVEVAPPVAVPLYLAYLPGARLDTVIGPPGQQRSLSLAQIDALLATLLPHSALKTR